MSTYFLSDLHLGAPYFPDSRDAEKRVVSFLDSISQDADAIYLLGDILDYWYEYKYVVPRGFVRFFGKLAELSDKGIKITWVIGNHDIWIFDYIPNELGIRVVDGSLVETIEGKKFYLAHGDGEGKSGFYFRMMRYLFRNKLCQQLFSGIHPRWTVPFAYRWSRKSRSGGESRELPDEGFDGGLKSFALQYHAEHPDIDVFMFGHIHVLSREEILPGCELIILGEWIRTFSYAKINKEGLGLFKWE